MVDVIIPVHNCEKFITQCLESINKQSVTNTVFLTDDGSTDNIKPILKKHESSRVKVFFNNQNIGNLKTINNLLSKCKSEYIAFQDADDWSHNERMARQLEFMDRQNLDFCFTNFIKTDFVGEPLYCGFYKEELISEKNIIDLEPSICFASILFKREIYEKVGGFNAYFDHIGGADIDWFYRIYDAGFKGGIITKPLYYYRNNDMSYTSRVSLDPRKKISVSIARYLYQYKLSHKVSPSSKALSGFISAELKKINFNEKANIKDYIVQIVTEKQYLKSLKYLVKYLFTKPFNFSDFKILRYMLYKIVNGGK